MYQFILFEGLDRTGKSTIAKEVAKKLNAILLHSPPDILIPYRKHFDSLDNETNLSYYITANHVLDCQIGDYLSKQNVVCDRYYFTTIAYHSAKLERNIDYLLKEMKTTPNKIYYLTGEVTVLNARAEKTGLKNDRFHGIDLWKKVEFNYNKLFKRFSNVVKIDTTNKTEEEVLQIVLNDLKRGKK